MTEQETTDTTTTVTTPQGPTLAVSDRGPKAAGLPVVFLNSLAADMSMWNDVRGRLTRRTLAYDARGHGASTNGSGDCTVADLGRDTLAVMDAAGIDRAVLCGLSLGGATAMWIAGNAPERVAGLVLANTASSFPPATMWQDRAQQARAGGFADLVDPTLDRWLTQAFRDAHPQAADTTRTMIAATPAEGYAACCMALAQGDTSNDLASYDGPVLIIAGRHDLSTPVTRAEQMQAMAKNARLEILEAAHLSSVEAGADFARLLEDFTAQAAQT